MRTFLKNIIAQSGGKSNTVKLRSFLRKYRNDLLLFLGLAVLIGVLFLVVYSLRKEGRILTVEVNGEKVSEFALSEEVTYPIRTNEGENVLRISGGEAWIESADCRDKICVHRGKIRESGETIVCLPHKVVVTVKAGGSE